jgi:hypothetical protein
MNSTLFRIRAQAHRRTKCTGRASIVRGAGAGPARPLALLRRKTWKHAGRKLGGEEAVGGGQREPGLGLQLHRDGESDPGRGGGGGLHPRAPHLGHGPEVPRLAAGPAAAAAVPAGGASPCRLLELLRHQQRDVRHPLSRIWLSAELADDDLALLLSVVALL